MKRSLKSLSLFSLGGTDGEIGKVKELYLDDEFWNIRYWVVDTGDWLPNKKVLIAVQSLLLPDWKNRILETNLTLDQIKNSPDIDTDKPVSRQQEAKLYEHFSWHNYWFSPFTNSENEALLNGSRHNEDAGNPHLRSSRVLVGYQIQASDGPIGHLIDFIIDTDLWEVIFLVVEIGSLLSSEKVLLPVRTVSEISWSRSKISITLNKQEIKKSIGYRPEAPANALVDGTFVDYYGRTMS